jgi:hypothetical protein
VTKGRRGSRQRKQAPKGDLKKPRSVRFVTTMAFVLPGSGQVFNGAPARGVIMQFGMVFGAFISYQLTTPDTSPLGRMAFGLLVYVFSIVDANGIARRRVKAWERIEAGQLDKPGKGAKSVTDGKTHTSGGRKKDVGDVGSSASPTGRPPGEEPPGPGEPAGSEDGAGSEPVSS